MKVQTIASGSKGNCTIVLCNDTNLIIDMGISYLTLKNSLEENSLSFDNFKGILITHCHLMVIQLVILMLIIYLI